MNRQTSFGKIKPASRESSKTHSNHSQIKSSELPHRKTEHHGQPTNPLQSKVKKNGSKGKIKKEELAQNKSKVGGHKQSPDNHAIHMKNNLKQLMHKNMGQKVKVKDVVP